jgi:hypothetical protein
MKNNIEHRSRFDRPDEIQGIRDRRNVSAITEELYRMYPKNLGKAATKVKKE